MNKFWVSSSELVRNLRNWCITKGGTFRAAIVSILMQNYEITGKDVESIADRILEVTTHGEGASPRLLQSAKYEGTCSVCGKKILIGAEIYWHPLTKRTWHTGCKQPEQFFRKLIQPRNLIR